jgi:uncharacterized protein YdeI (YjbR/CyaY-like superfamily)
VSDGYEQCLVGSREEWRSWLGEHHDTSPGVWVVTWKKSSGGPHLPYDDVVEEALAHGWVDSKGRKLDDDRSQLLVTPRKPGSGWSRANKARIDRLEAARLMRPAGEAAVALAKRNGAWNALDDFENLTEPPDLGRALDDSPKARQHWEAFPPSAKRAILEWIGTAKREETRARRVQETARLAEQDIRANQWRQRKKGRGS